MIVSTHSPILVTLPGATVFEPGPWGMRKADSFEDPELVKTWRDFLESPERFLHYLLED
ncbi:MAG TPA: hypothetical protein VFV09_15630 [Actinomycetota bacterium]|nr:hypothetical protein [Actinomycetota bacterium]